MLLQLIHILNIWCLLASSSGILMHQHFCQDQLKSVSFVADFNQTCCAKKAKKIKSCCSKKKTKATCCSSKKKSCSQTLSFHKKKCCVDKKAYAQVDAESSLSDTVEGELSFLSTVPVATDLMVYLGKEPSPNNTPFVIEVDFGFEPPPKMPRYIAFQSFLC